MLCLRAGHGDMTDLGQRFVTSCVRAADDAGLPDDQEFRAVLRDYTVRAVDDVLRSSPEGSAMPGGVPVPRWSWDGLVRGDPRSGCTVEPVTDTWPIVASFFRLWHFT